MGKDLVPNFVSDNSRTHHGQRFGGDFGSGDSRAPGLFLFRFSVELRISALNDYNHLICQNIGVNVYSRFLLTIGTIYF